MTVKRDPCAGEYQRRDFIVERKPPAVPVVPKSFSYAKKKYPPLV